MNQISSIGRAFLLALALLLCLSACTSAGDGDPSIETNAQTDPAGVGDGDPSASTSDQAGANPTRPTAPDFTVLDGEGRSVQLSDFRGRPVVLNFWASWCPPCKAEMPDFETVYTAYGDRVAFLIVNLTDGGRETMETAKAHIAANGYTFPVYFDTTYSAARAYAVNSIPATFFIDSEGCIDSYERTMIDADTLVAGINRILPET